MAKNWRPSPLPEGGAAVTIGVTAHLGDHLVGKTLAKRGHKQETRLGEQLAVLAVPELRIQKQGAEFAVAGMVIAQKQGRHLAVDAQLLGGMNQSPNPVVVPGLGQPDRRLQTTDPHHLLLFALLEHEQVALLGQGGCLIPAGEHPLDPRQQALFIEGERGHTDPGLGRQSGDRGQIIAPHRTNEHHDNYPCALNLKRKMDKHGGSRAGWSLLLRQG